MRDTNLRISFIILILLFLIIASVDAVADRKRDQEQADRKACETFYADFGAQSGRRAPLFYDLPECVEAFEYQNSQRQR